MESLVCGERDRPDGSNRTTGMYDRISGLVHGDPCLNLVKVVNVGLLRGLEVSCEYRST